MRAINKIKKVYFKCEASVLSDTGEVFSRKSYQTQVSTQSILSPSNKNSENWKACFSTAVGTKIIWM